MITCKHVATLYSSKCPECEKESAIKDIKEDKIYINKKN